MIIEYTPEEYQILEESGYDLALENPQLNVMPRQKSGKNGGKGERKPCGCDKHKAKEIMRTINVETAFTTIFMIMLFVAMVAVIVKSIRVIFGKND